MRYRKRDYHGRGRKRKHIVVAAGIIIVFADVYKRQKGDILANLRKEVKKADKIYLATDPDREGEAISWHLYVALKLEGKKVYRISFNEITKNAVKASIKDAREINMNLVDAQQARRALDRMVGYKISPLLWAKVKRGLSAGSCLLYTSRCV